jgi:uncharacterized membrane protein YdjX (TVP38/TMEM64 family)
MTEALANFINDTGWLAPVYYVLSFVVTALVPVVPTPLVGALGGAAFGTGLAVFYGVFGLALGAFVALNLSRRLGRPLLLRLVSPKAWAEWETLVGIRNVVVWGVIFFVLNVDVAVIAAGLSQVRLRHLWAAAMIARFPWLVASAWFGEVVFVSDTVMYLALLGLIAAVVVFQKLRPRFQHWLVARVAEPLPEGPPVTEPGADPAAAAPAAPEAGAPTAPVADRAVAAPGADPAPTGAGLGIVAGSAGRVRRGARRRGR